MQKIMSNPCHTDFFKKNTSRECFIIFSDQSDYTSAMNKETLETFHDMILHHFAACYCLTSDNNEGIEFFSVPVKTVGDEIVITITWEDNKEKKMDKGKIVEHLLIKINDLMQQLDEKNIFVKLCLHYIKNSWTADHYLKYIQLISEGSLEGTNDGLHSINYQGDSGNKTVIIPLSKYDVFGIDVNFAARIMSIAKGHMALMSEDAYSLIADENTQIRQTFNNLSSLFDCDNDRFPSELFYNIKSFEDMERPKKIYQIPIKYNQTKEKHKHIYSINLKLNILTLVYFDTLTDAKDLKTELIENEHLKSSYLTIGLKDRESKIQPSNYPTSDPRKALLVRWGFYDLDTYHHLINKHVWNIERNVKHVKSNIIVNCYNKLHSGAIDELWNDTIGFSGFLCLLKFDDISDIVEEHSTTCWKIIRQNHHLILKELKNDGFEEDLIPVEIGTMFGEYDIFIIYAYKREKNEFLEVSEGDYGNNTRYAEIMSKTILRLKGLTLSTSEQGVEVWPLIDIAGFLGLDYVEAHGNELKRMYERS